MIALDALAPEMAWMAEAKCQGMDSSLFFPERWEPITEARKICEACPVRRECLDYALADGIEFGVWGGMSGRDRRRIGEMRRRRPSHPDTSEFYRLD